MIKFSREQGNIDFSSLEEYFICIALLSEPYRTTFSLFLCFLAVRWDVVTWLRQY